MTDRRPVVVQCDQTPAGWTCTVTVAAAGTTHVVTVFPADLARLAPGATDPTDLVERSFAFLLAREPADAILRRFDLPLIGRYFPEYEATILAP